MGCGSSHAQQVTTNLTKAKSNLEHSESEVSQNCNNNSESKQRLILIFPLQILLKIDELKTKLKQLKEGQDLVTV